MSLPTETDTKFIHKKQRNCHVCCPQNAAESPREISQPRVRAGLEVGLSVFHTTISPVQCAINQAAHEMAAVHCLVRIYKGFKETLISVSNITL